MGKRSGKGKSNTTKILAVFFIWGTIMALIAAVFFKFIFKPETDKKLESKTSAKSQYDREVTINLDSFSGYSVLRSDDFKAELKASRIRVNLEDDGADYNQRIRDLESGKAQMAVFTIDSLIYSSVELGSWPGTIVLAIDESNGADAVVAFKSAMPNLNSLDHGDARMVLTPDSPSEFMARIITSHFSLQGLPKNYVISADGSADVLKKFNKTKSSEKKAFVMWEPDVSKALENPDAHILMDSAKIRGYIYDVLVVQRKFLADNEEIVQKVVEAYLRSAYKNREDMISLVKKDARETGGRLSPQQAEKVVKGILWKNSVENYAHFGLLDQAASKGLDHLEDVIQRITDVLVKTGSLSEDPFEDDYNKLFYDQILLNLKNKNFHPGRAVNLLGDDVGMLDPEAVRGAVELPALSDSEWERLVSVGKLDVNPVSFGRGKASIGMQSQRDLKTLAAKLKTWPNYYLLVVGHARKAGDVELNRQLAHQRAEAVRNYLIKDCGVSANRVKARAVKVLTRGGRGQSVSFVVGQMPY